jgi:hypothetical protein
VLGILASSMPEGRPESAAGLGVTMRMGSRVKKVI